MYTYVIGKGEEMVNESKHKKLNLLVYGKMLFNVVMSRCLPFLFGEKYSQCLCLSSMGMKMQTQY